MCAGPFTPVIDIYRNYYVCIDESDIINQTEKYL